MQILSMVIHADSAMLLRLYLSFVFFVKLSVRNFYATPITLASVVFFFIKKNIFLTDTQFVVRNTQQCHDGVIGMCIC